MGTNRSYGIEIEAGSPVYPYPPDDWRGTETPINTGIRAFTGWRIKGDGSLSSRRDGEYMCEVVSPILKGAAGIAQIRGVCDLLNANEVEPNHSCGLHVHVAHEGFDDPLVAKLDAAFTAYELAFFGQAGGGTRRRMEGGSWCKPKHRQEGESNRHDRYCALNLSNYYHRDGWGSGKPTFECRAFGPTTNWKKIAGAVFLIVGLVEAVKSGILVSPPPRFSDPRIAMTDLIELFDLREDDFLPDGVDDETKSVVFAQLETQAAEAARVLHVA